MPVSITLKVMVVLLPKVTHSICKVIFPFLVYFVALESKFINIWYILTSSPYKTLGIFPMISTLNLIGFSDRDTLTILVNSAIISAKQYSLLLTDILPSSIFVISKILLTISSRVSPALLIFLTSSYMDLGTSLLKIDSDKPIMAFIGVLISWLMLAKK